MADISGLEINPGSNRDLKINVHAFFLPMKIEKLALYNLVGCEASSDNLYCFFTFQMEENG